MKTLLILTGLLALAVANATAALRTETVTYRQGDTTLEGRVVYDDALPGKRPGVLVVHQWMGLGDYETKRAELLAQMGYVAFCADIYGQGVRPANPAEAGKQAGVFKNDRKLLRARAAAALDALKQRPNVDATKVAAIGYCFGGTTVLELARNGSELKGVVSFHGGLGSPTPEDAKSIKCRVLVCHGADDPYVPPAEVAAFETEMRQAKVDWQLISYGGAVHSFTHWTAGSDTAKGAAYHEPADRRSWEHMKSFFAELFK